MSHGISVSSLLPQTEEARRVRRRADLGSAAAALGIAAAIAAWAMPFSGYWLIVSAGLALGALVASVFVRPCPKLTLVALVVLVLLVLGGIASVPLTLAGLGIAILLRHQPVEGRGLSLALLGLQSSFTGTPEALISNALAPYSLEAVAPALVAAAFIAIPCWRQAPSLVVGAVLTVCVASGARWLEAGPSAEAAIASLPIILVGAWLGAGNSRGSTGWGLILCCALGLSWNVTPPRLGLVNEVSIVLPADRSAPEAIHFHGITEALRFSGLTVNEPSELKEISTGSVVILPWLSVAFAEDEEGFAAEFRALARERRWTVVMFGEHDGMGGLDARAEALAGRPLFHRDLTVPTGNSDTSGQLRASSLRAWPPSAMLNRGATTNVFDARARVLLSADGWWAERDLQEWLWTGDYRWRPGDRGGRLLLAHAVVDLQGATWVAIGDTTPILTRQLIADPRPVLRLLDKATLIPALLADVSLLLGWFAIVLFGRASSRLAWAASFIALSVLWAGLLLPERHAVNGGWRSLNIGESGYEASNFNATLAAEPQLLEQGWDLVRSRNAVNGSVRIPSRPTVSFLLIDGSAEFGNIRLSECWRLGSLNVGESGPRLMDAQACKVEGDVDVIVGERSGAAALLVRSASVPWIIMLDRGFLSGMAPLENARWLQRLMEAARAS
jgi:hypothetical protein